MRRNTAKRLKILFLFIVIITISLKLVFYHTISKLDKPIAENECDNYCYMADKNRDQYNYFGSMSKYPKINASSFKKIVNVPNCKPVKIWILFRHGARWPARRQLSLFATLYKIRLNIMQYYAWLEKQSSVPQECKMCDEDLDLLQNWNIIHLNDKEYYTLSPQGWKDLEYLASSFQQTFPELFDVHYTPETYLLRHTIQKRTVLSYEAFVQHLFGKDAHQMINLSPPPRRDMLLMPYFACKETDEHSKSVFEEVDKFVNGAVFLKMIEKMVLKLGIPYTDIQTIWKQCQYEQSWNEGKPSPWCAVFSPDAMKVINYWEDLGLFYKKSHGYRMNTELVCNTVVDMLNHLQDSHDSPKVVAYFVHSTLIFLFLTTLGLIQDAEPLLANNYDRMQDRRFKASDNVPFAANFAAVKYECPYDTDRVKIMFLLNQKPIHFAQCRDQNICTWNEVSQILAKYNQANCDKVFCTNSTLSDLYPNKPDPQSFVGFFNKLIYP